jgi:hypothetical protein
LVLDLIQADDYPTLQEHKEIINSQIAPILLDELLNAKEPFSVAGSVSIKPYPPSAYLTQLAFRVLTRCVFEATRLEELSLAVKYWARSEIHR